MNFKILFLIVFLSSCTLAARVIYGVKTPKAKSSNYILDKSNKFELTHFNHYSISEKGFINFFKNREDFNISSSLSHVIVFDENGNLVQPKDTINCPSDVPHFINSYYDLDINIIFDTVYFTDVFGDSINSLTNPNQYLSVNANKPLFVVTWASFLGRFNKINTKKWADSIQNIVQSGEANAIFLSFDVRENWEMSK